MLIELSIAAVTALNICAWLVIQLGLAWSFTRLPVENFHPHGFWARPKSWERNGRLYERVFAIKLWKDKLPDASRFLQGGFAKSTLQTADAEYLERFLREAWRGELVHWLALLPLPLFAIWNPWWGLLVNAAVALALNLPCILSLRYNRARLHRLLARKHSRP